MRELDIPGGKIVQLLPVDKKEAELPPPVGKVVSYVVHASFLRIPYDPSKAGPVAFGVGPTEDIAWQKAVKIIQGELARLDEK